MAQRDWLKRSREEEDTAFWGSKAGGAPKAADLGVVRSEKSVRKEAAEADVDGMRFVCVCVLALFRWRQIRQIYGSVKLP